MRQIRLLIACLLLGPATGSLSPAVSYGEEHLRVGVFHVDASPPIGSPLAYDPTRAVTSPLSSRGLVILGNDSPIVLCAVDWIGASNEGFSRFREALAGAAKTPANRVAVHTLHQHDAPWCDFTVEELLAAHGLGGATSDPVYCRGVIERTARAVAEAIAAAQPVTHISLGQARVERVASNRRVLGRDGKVAHVRWTATQDPVVRAFPEGVIDPNLRLVGFWNGERPLAALTFYATHPQSYYRTGEANPDFPGLARDRRQSESGLAHIHFCGAGGNIGAGKFNDGDPRHRQELADRLAAGMEQAWATARKSPLQPGQVSWSSVDVELPVAAHLSEQNLLSELGDAARPALSRKYAACALAWLRRRQSGEKIDIGCLQLPGARVLFMPGELFVEYQLAAQEMRPDLFVAMAAYGDYSPWYIGTTIAYRQGGYETSPGASLVAPQVEEVLVGAMRTLLETSSARTAPLGEDIRYLPHAPVDLGGNPAWDDHPASPASAAVALPDRSLASYFRRSANGNLTIFETRSADEGRTWSTPSAVTQLSVEPWGGPVPLVDRDGEVHLVISKMRGDGRRPAVDRFIDLYHLRTTAGRSQWTAPQQLFSGYCGALQQVVQLRSGRLLVPFADWLPGVPVGPPSGPNVATVVYSDDGGKTWIASGARLTAPCTEGYNGANYGACEPTLVELSDGRVWMLLRTQTGRLYESFSRDGVEWSPALPTEFASSNSPAFPLRLPDGRLVLFWNNCQMPPRLDGQGVYAGRDALHAAISSDDGKTWRGFREVYRDPHRNQTPPKSGDRGTAYPHAVVTAEGEILLVSGQGAERRRRLLIDPDWLLEKAQEERFTTLDAWHVFKSFGPAERFWRDRTQGARLVAHPELPGAQVLQIRRPDDRDADGAIWNFPSGRQGTLRIRIKVSPTFQGGQISLADRMFDPCDDQGEQNAAFAYRFDSATLSGDGWRDLEFAWDLDQSLCRLAIDGRPAAPLPLLTDCLHGLSYLRLRSLARTVDEHGFLVESASVQVD